MNRIKSNQKLETDLIKNCYQFLLKLLNETNDSVWNILSVWVIKQVDIQHFSKITWFILVGFDLAPKKQVPKVSS